MVLKNASLNRIMIEINIINESDSEVLETLKIKQIFEFLIYRGRLLQNILGTNNFIERAYLELY